MTNHLDSAAKSGLPFSTVITGATVISPMGVDVMDIGISGEKVAALSAEGELVKLGQRVIDAKGLIATPGGIDPHVHASFKPPNFDLASGQSALGPPEELSKAALFGGTTTLIDFSWVPPEGGVKNTLEESLRSWTGSCCCDFSFHINLRGDLTAETLAEVRWAIDQGFPSFKVFTTNVFPGHPVFKLEFGSLWELCKTTAIGGGIIAVHAEDDELVMHMYKRMEEEGTTHFSNMPQVHSKISEDVSFRRVISLAKNVPGCALYMMHVSTADGVAAIEEARLQGLPIYGETLHQYALRSEDEYLKSRGVLFHTYPSLHGHEDNAALWDGISRNVISTFATDAVCTTFDLKTAGDRIDTVIGGNVGIEPRLALVYEEAVVKRGLGLARFAEITSTNAAKILGLYPKKGAIIVGGDADIVLLDPATPKVISADLLHESDYTPWEGTRVSAWPVMTLLRGKVVVEDGKFHGDRSHGAVVPRKLEPSVHSGRVIEAPFAFSANVGAAKSD